MCKVCDAETRKALKEMGHNVGDKFGYCSLCGGYVYPDVGGGSIQFGKKCYQVKEHTCMEHRVREIIE